MRSHSIRNILVACYLIFFIPVKRFFIRRKKSIKVAFVLSELGLWKTESLYVAMTNHTRFHAIIVVVNSKENSYGEKELVNYLNRKQYAFLKLDDDVTVVDACHPDIIFYQKPYPGVLSRAHQYSSNFRALFCYVPYGFYSIKERWTVNQPLHKCAWQIYLENSSAYTDLAPLCNYNANKLIVTGLPMEDGFLNYDKSQCDPWPFDRKYKRIIWAPHHTLNDSNELLQYSTFLEYHEVMLDLMEKYRDSVRFAFKPHPLLRPKLELLWGKEKTDLYFDKWESNELSIVLEGEYVDLFMHSDALVHDCGSFTVEYMYTHKPALYLENSVNHENTLTGYARDAYNLHYKAHSKHDIEDFIIAVIGGEDRKKEDRELFIKSQLTPPGSSACENIIASIIGKTGSPWSQS